MQTSLVKRILELEFGDLQLNTAVTATSTDVVAATNPDYTVNSGCIHSTRNLSFIWHSLRSCRL